MREFWNKLPLKRLSLGWEIAWTALLSLVELLLVLYIQPGSLWSVCKYLFLHPLLLLLNFLPLWLITVCFWFLFANAFYGAACAGTLGGILSLVNRTMIESRDEPLSPKDFALIREAGDALGSYNLNIHIGSLAAIIVFMIAMLLLGKMFGGKRPFQKLWKNICLALTGAVLSLGILVGCVCGIYSSKDLYNSFPIGNPYYIAGVYNQFGFPYCFCYNFFTYPVDKPEGYSAKQVEQYIAEAPEKTGDGKPVNVIMVMNEAFSDVTNHPAFAYAEGQEPLHFFNSLKDSENAIAGHIVVPNFGAGTANTEFDVLTGMQTNLISQSGTSAFRVLHSDINSLFRVFRKDDYQTEFIHPGQDWFYNRQNVYRYFGAEKLMFSQEFSEAETKGTWVTDTAVADKIKTEFESAVAIGKPYFNYTVTIQNHMAYSADKYGDYTVPQAPLNVSVSEEAQTLLSVYAEGARDADAMLKELTEYYTNRSEPVVLVFFGDHQPNLGNNYLAYRELGIEIGEGQSPDAVLRTYETPYVIWVNDAAREMLDFSATRATLGLPEDNTISANYLGAVLLELTGRKDEDAFFSFLNDMRRELPVLHNDIGRTSDGQNLTALSEPYGELIQKLRYWEYHKLKNEQIK